MKTAAGGVRALKTLSGNLPFVLVLIAGALLRFYSLGRRSVWFDESVVLLESGKRLPELFSVNSEGIHPPLYRVLMHFWMHWGQGEFFARIPSAILGLLTVVIGYKLAKAVFDREIALLAAFFLAVSPFQVYYAQDVKAYTLLLFLSLSSIYAFVRVIKNAGISGWLAYTILTALSLYTHYFTVFNIFAQNICVLLLHKDGKFLKRWFFSQLAVLMAFLPWLPGFVTHVLRVKEYFWVPDVSVAGALAVFRNFSLGYYSGGLDIFPVKILFLLLFAGGILSVFFNRKGTSARTGRDRKVLIASLFLLPVAASLVISKMVKPIHLDRGLITTSFFYYLLISAGAMKLCRKKFLFFSCVGLLVVVFVFGLDNYYTGINFRHSVGIDSKEKQYREAAQYINYRRADGDIILFSHCSSWFPFTYYFADKAKESAYLVDAYKDDLDKDISTRLPGIRKIHDIGALWSGASGVWVICSYWNEHIFTPVILVKWMNAHKEEMVFPARDFSGIVVYYFKRFRAEDGGNTPLSE